MFGRKRPDGATQPPSATTVPPFVQAPRDSDGRRRIFGEEIYEQHGDFLRMLGRDVNDPSNILPEEEDHQRKMQDSLDQQEQRRQGIEAELLARHGVNAIRPFFVLAEPVMNSALGLWLMRVMDLQPYEDWNLVYLPTDRATANVMDLPLHPGVSIGPIDELMVKRMEEFHARFADGRNKAHAAVSQGDDAQFDVMERFLAYKDKMRRDIVDYVLSVKPMLVALIADVQSKSGSA